MRSIAIGIIRGLTLAISASAQERQLVTFEVVHTATRAARDVYLLSDIVEVGAQLGLLLPLVAALRSRSNREVTHP